MPHMSFAKQYRAVQSLFDAGDRTEAAERYVDLFTNYKSQVLDAIRAQEEARVIWRKLMQQHALRKILIQRIKGQEVIDIDLSLFAIDTPFHLTFDTNVSTFLDSWKGESAAFLWHKESAERYCDEIRRNTVSDIEIPELSDADVYAVFWVLFDLFLLDSSLPANPTGYVSLGCGSGMFDCAYLRSIGGNIPAVLVDTDQDAYTSVKSLVHRNGLSNTTYASSWHSNLPPPSFVLSIRSCGFVYDVREYNHLFKNLKTDSFVILDVRFDRTTATEKYFTDLGFKVEQLPIKANHKGNYYKFTR